MVQQPIAETTTTTITKSIQTTTTESIQRYLSRQGQILGEQQEADDAIEK